jgi:hypothetical protein
VIKMQRPILEDSFYKISIYQIIKTIEREMEFNYFTVGRRIVMKQKAGIAIGGKLSSPLAIMVAARAIHKTFQTVHDKIQYKRGQEKMIDGVSITDDVTIWTVINKEEKEGNQLGWERIKQFFEDFKKHTSNTLNVVLEPESDTYNMAECTITNMKEKIICTFNNKNFESIVEHGKQKVKKGIARKSPHGNHIKINIIRETMKAIQENCTNKHDCYIHLAKYIFEIIQIYDWDQKWIKDALFSMQNSNFSIDWLKIYKDLWKGKRKIEALDVLQYIELEQIKGII